VTEERMAYQTSGCGFFNDALRDVAETLAAKNHDYAGGEDHLANFREFGLLGIVVRIGDKFHRLKGAVRRGGELAVSEESLRDTLRDLAGYAICGMTWLDEDVKPSISRGPRDQVAHHGSGDHPYSGMMAGEKR
jgi:hypothetical protein